jgi:sugar lactone lactonase YvrE
MANNKDFKVKNGIQPTAYHENVGTVSTGSTTVGYNLSGASYDSVSVSVQTQYVSPVAFAMKDDGTKLYMHGASGDRLYQYSLSTAWSLSTMTYDNISFLTATQNGNAGPVAFKSDGTSFYVSGSTNDTVYQYDMTTAWDISTASYASKSFSVGSQETSPTGLFFKSDGTKMYMCGTGTDTLYQYSLSTAWDVSTASYDSVSFSLTGQGTFPTSLFFKSDGTQFYTTDTNGVFKYSLSTAWDISTASFTETFNSTTESASPYQSWFKSDGTRMFVLGASNDRIYQYTTEGTLATKTLDMSTGTAFEITPTADIQIGLSNPAASGTVSQATLLLDGAFNSFDLSTASYDNVNFSVSSQDLVPMDVRFKPDGTKMYVLGRGNDAVYQYSLSTAFDLSTASYDSVLFYVNSQDANPYGFEFKPDGLKFYVVGNSNDTVYQYSLSAAWDMSTASYDSVSFSISQDTVPYGVTFNDDGTKMYILGLINDSVFQYSLSTAYDLSTASYDSVSFAFTSQDTAPLGFVFNNDGTKAFMSGTTNDNVYQYTLSTAYDISTLSYDSVAFSVSSQVQVPSGITFNNDGSKMYLLGSTSDTVFQYSIGSTATITYDDSIQFSGGTAPTSPEVGETDVLSFTTRDNGTTYSGILAIDGAK